MGVLVPPDDAEALAAALLEVLAAPERLLTPAVDHAGLFSCAGRGAVGAGAHRAGAPAGRRRRSPPGSRRFPPRPRPARALARRRNRHRVPAARDPAARLPGIVELHAHPRLRVRPGLHLRLRLPAIDRTCHRHRRGRVEAAAGAGARDQCAARPLGSRRCPSPRPASTPCSSPKRSSTSMTRGRCSGGSGRCSGPAASWRSRCLTRAIPGRGIRLLAHGRPWRRPFRRGPLVGIWTNHARPVHRRAARAVREAGGLRGGSRRGSDPPLPAVPSLPGLRRRQAPPRARAAAARRVPAHWTRATAAPAPTRGPLAVVRQLVDRIDAANDGPGVANRGTFVNVLLKARRPDFVSTGALAATRATPSSPGTVPGPARERRRGAPRRTSRARRTGRRPWRPRPSTASRGRYDEDLYGAVRPTESRRRPRSGIPL